MFQQKLIKSLGVKSIKRLRTAANLSNCSRGRLLDVSILMLLFYSVLIYGSVLKTSVPKGKSPSNLDIKAEATAADFIKQTVTVGRAGTVVTGIAGGDLTGLMLAGDLVPTLASTKIAYVRSQGGRQLIFVMNADGSEQSQLTPSNTDDVDPAWSPDGTRIIFASKVAGKYHLFVMKSDGSGRRQLTEGNGNERNPVWAPDGSAIAYSSDRNGRPEIMLINTDGSAQRQLGITAVVGSEPTWSLDGRRIAFQRDNDIYTMNSKGQELKQVTHDRSSSAPAWSPEGTLLSFVSRRSGNAEIYVADVDDADISRFQLTNDAGDDTAPTWSPDGSKLAFVSIRSGSAQVYEIQADASGLVRLTNNSSDSKPAWSPYIRPRAVLGNQGIFGKRASGALFARSHDTLGSIVVFDALSPDSTRVIGQPSSNLNQPNLTFTVIAEGSKLNRVAFLNGDEISPTVVIGAGSTVPIADGVMIDFDSDGRITAVIPFNN